MSVSYRNRVQFRISNTPGTAGNFNVSAAMTGYKRLGVTDDALTYDIIINEGSAWEIRESCLYTNSTNILSRGTLGDSSTGSAISFTSAAIVTVTLLSKRILPVTLGTSSNNDVIKFNGTDWVNSSPYSYTNIDTLTLISTPNPNYGGSTSMTVTGYYLPNSGTPVITTMVPIIPVGSYISFFTSGNYGEMISCKVASVTYNVTYSTITFTAAVQSDSFGNGWDSFKFNPQTNFSNQASFTVKNNTISIPTTNADKTGMINFGEYVDNINTPFAQIKGIATSNYTATPGQSNTGGLSFFTTSSTIDGPLERIKLLPNGTLRMLQNNNIDLYIDNTYTTNNINFTNGSTYYSNIYGKAESLTTGSLTFSTNNGTSNGPKLKIGPLGEIGLFNNIGTVFYGQPGLVLSSNGASAAATWSAPQPAVYAAYSNIPNPYTGLARVGHSLFTGNGDAALEVPYLNANSELVANIIPRTDSLANLLTTIGSAGELAVANDQGAIVKFTGGSTPGGNVFYTNSPEILQPSTSSTITPSNGFLTSGMLSTTNLITPRFGDDATPVYIHQISTTKFAVSYDYGNNYSIISTPATASYYMVTYGGIWTILDLAATVGIFYGVTNLPYTTALTADASGYTQANICAATKGITVGWSNNSFAIFTIGSNTLANYTLPSGITSVNLGILNGTANLVSASPQIFDNISLDTQVLSILVQYEPTLFATYDKLCFITQNTGGIIATSVVSLPIPLVVSPVVGVAFTKNKFFITTGGNIGYLGTYTKTTTSSSVSALTTITLPVSTGFSLISLQANRNYFYIHGFVGTSYLAYMSSDGINWYKLNNIENNINSTSTMSVLDCGALFTSNLTSVTPVLYTTSAAYQVLPAFNASATQSWVHNNRLNVVSTQSALCRVLAINGMPTKSTINTRVIPTTGSSYTSLRFNNYDMQPATTLASLTILLPLFPWDGQEVVYSFAATTPTAGIAITSLVYTPNPAQTGITVMGLASYPFGSVSQYSVHRMRYNDSASTWIKV